MRKLSSVIALSVVMMFGSAAWAEKNMKDEPADFRGVK